MRGYQSGMANGDHESCRCAHEGQRTTKVATTNDHGHKPFRSKAERMGIRKAAQ